MLSFGEHAKAFVCAIKKLLICRYLNRDMKRTTPNTATISTQYNFQTDCVRPTTSPISNCCDMKKMYYDRNVSGFQLF